ncbi:MAG: zinc ribbon domain-containing protein [Candidatus Poseidoniaceae archaeon]|nr:zinc ribbon domain-containing protein [Candidatus Poseidoniaceae archaeon]
MENFKWRSNPNIIARLVNGNDIKTWKARQVVLKPNEACAFIIDGRIGEIISESVVRNIGGGLGRHIAEMLGSTANDRRMLFAMTGPVDLTIPFNSAMKDGSSANGLFHLRIQMRKEDIPKLLNVFANSAPLLDRIGLAQLLGNEISTRCIIPAMAKCANTEELRSPEFQEHLEMHTEVEMRQTLSNLGYTFLRAFISTNKTDQERLAKLRADLDMATQTEGANAEALMERIAIREAATLRRIECEVNVERAKKHGEVTVQAEAELLELRKQEAVWEAELVRDRGQADLRMAESSHKTAQAMELFEQVQARKRDRIQQSQEHQDQRMDKQNDIQMKMMEMAASEGALTPEVMQEFLRQQTAQKAIDGTDDNSAPTTPMTATCQQCGSALEHGWKVCPHCGVAQ